MQRVHFIVASEVTLPYAALTAAFGRDVCLLGVRPLIPGASEILRGLAKMCVRRGLFTDAAVRFPHIRKMLTIDHFCNMTDMFLNVESWVERYFDFASVDRIGDEYAMLYKHVCWGEVYHEANLAHAVSILNRGADPERAIFSGLNATITGLAAAYGRRPVAAPRRYDALRAVANICLTGLVLGYTAWFVLRRIVSRMPPRQHHLLGSTYARDMRLLKNLEDIADSRNQVCLMFHNDSFRDSANKAFDLAGFRQCLFGDGRFTPAAAIVAVGRAVRDGYRVLRYGLAMHPRSFRVFARMIWYRAAYRALFETHRFDYFWGRDEYNAEHIVRNQEMRRVGGISLGIFHGIPTSQILSPLRRVQYWDILYMFGTHFCDTYYKAKWPASMRVHAIGGFGLSHAELRSLPPNRSRDIMIFASSTLDNEAIVRESIKLAQFLPDHTVTFKCKPADAVLYKDLLNGTIPVPSNLKFAPFDLSVTYTFLQTGGYVIASHSTIAAEGIHCGVPSFVHDNQPPEFPFYYREFERLCFTDATEVAQRIRAIESGAEDYPWHLYGGLVDLSNRYPMSIVRHDMGLPPKPDEDVCDALAQRRARSVPVELKRVLP